MNDEFLEFSQSNTAPPMKLDGAVKRSIDAKLNPPAAQWLGKFFVIHAVAGTLTLLVCPQLGVGPLLSDISLMHVFMSLGPAGCALACGAFFFSLSALLTALVLSGDELRKLRAHELANFAALAAVSYAVLMLIGKTPVDWTVPFWAIGAVLGGKIFSLAGNYVRTFTVA